MLSRRSHQSVAPAADALTVKERRIVVWAPLVAALAIAALYPVAPRLYFFVVMEYMLVEDLQVVFYLVASVLAAVLARRLWRARDTRLLGALYGVAAVGLFLVAGEEISWGGELFERIIPGWPEKEELRRVNAQGETTLHNLNGLGRVFNRVLFLLALYGVLSPLVRAAIGRRASRRWVDFVVFPAATVPGLLISVAFFVALLFLTGSHDDVSQQTGEHAFLRFQEVAELNIAFSIVVFVLGLVRATAGRPSGTSERPARWRAAPGT